MEGDEDKTFGLTQRSSWIESEREWGITLRGGNYSEAGYCRTARIESGCDWGRGYDGEEGEGLTRFLWHQRWALDRCSQKTEPVMKASKERGSVESGSGGCECDTARRFAVGIVADAGILLRGNTNPWDSKL